MANEIKKGINKILKDKQYQEVIELLKKNETGNKDEDRVTPFVTGFFSALAEKEPEKLKEVVKTYLKDQETKFNDLDKKKKENEELTEHILEGTEQVANIESELGDAQQEIKDMMQKMKLVEEDIKGAAVDETV